MNNKKMVMSFLLVVLVAISLSAVSAADVNNDTLAVDEPVVGTAADVQTQIDGAVAGDTITLEKDEYDFVNNTVKIEGKDKLTVQGNGKTVIKGYGGTADGKSGALFLVSESIGVTFKDITFIDTNPNNNLTYNGNVAGYGITFDGSGAANGTVDNCSFKDFSTAVNVKSCNYVTVKNSNFTGGASTKLINDPTVNKEKGSKVVSAGGSFYLSVLNCTFDGPMLDGVSIYGGSGDAKIIGNTFKGNVYAIFFGGASTEGTYINDNTFIECGQFVKNETTTWTAFPVISIEKASDSVYMNNNTFYAVNGNKLIAAESANTAHGAPSSLGDINITNSTVALANDDVVAESVTFLHILSRTGDINPFEPITLTGNTYADGVKAVVVWYNDWGSENSGDIVISKSAEPVAEPVTTVISASTVSVYAGNSATLKLTLKDANGTAIANKKVSVIIDGVTTTLTTDANGVATKTVKYSTSGTHYVTMAFTGDSNYTGAIKNVKISVLKKATTLTAAKKTFKSATKTKKVTVTLKTGKTVLKYKKVTFKVNGKTYTAKTNSKGVATFSIKLTKKGTFKALSKFAGDGAYKASSKYSYVVIK